MSDIELLPDLQDFVEVASADRVFGREADSDTCQLAELARRIEVAKEVEACRKLFARNVGPR
ncbi:hypothetical protein [Variovorax sp. KK3]|uniref:hypothetical protein n=1 Tax=Variovorax sp. KK3 TaxID=1855728 RepID=UPI00097C8E33|nr:hypothetical protein [Variovorax sp. KK3]